MKKKFIFKYLFVFFMGLIIFDSCKKDPEISPKKELIEASTNEINLRWIQNYPTETKADFEKGMLWGFSFLGATLPKGCLDKGFVWLDDSHFVINFKALGFNEKSLIPVNALINLLKLTGEYEQFESIDAGRLMVLFLNDSHHYYAITGVANTFDSFHLQYDWDNKKGAIIESAIATFNREIEIYSNNSDAIAFSSTEGQGEIINSTFAPFEYEVTELMDNGQFRFAIYNLGNNLIASANPTKTVAGKPAKCLWCHESGIQTGFVNNTSVENYYTANQFDSIVIAKGVELSAYRNTLNSEINFADKQAHALLEKLYISFMEPSKERLAMEWNSTITEVENALVSFETHQPVEFLDLGVLYDRKDVDSQSDYSVLLVPHSAREQSSFEPNYLIP